MSDQRHSLSESVCGPAESTTTLSFPENELSKFQLAAESHLWLIESAPDAMVITDQEGIILHVNAQTEKVFGYRREELIGEAIEKLVPKPFRRNYAQFGSLYTTAPRFCLVDASPELHGQRKDGSEFPVEVSLSPVETAKGTVVYSIIRDTSERVAAQNARRQAALEKTLSGLSATLINLPVNRVDQGIQNGLAILGDALGADRATLGLLELVSEDILILHSWARSGFPEFGERIVKGMLPWLERRIKAGEATLVAKPEDLPPEAHIERRYMEFLGEKSALIVPFWVSGRVIGGMSCDSFREYQQWDTITISRVQDVADIFANAISRKNDDEKLQRAYAEIKGLKDQLEKRDAYLREEIELEKSHNTVVGNSAAIRRVLKKAEQVAPTDSTVLVLGETGTGKELIARTIHELSNRHKRPMVKTNCAALPATLIESELFGREKGAYTGALAREIGRFELADQSTIFLDEVGELPPEVQSKLLRVLQEGQFERLGSSKTIQVNVRVIAATSRNLQAMVKDGKMREDLFYRLNVFPILIPPMRERREDIPALVWHVLKEFGTRMGRNVEGVHASTMREFQKYDWPGNVRELRNVIERSLIINTGPVFRAEIPELAHNSNRGMRCLKEVEAEYFCTVLRATQWRIRGRGGAAEVLGLKPTTLEAKMKKLGIQRPH